MRKLAAAVYRAIVLSRAIPEQPVGPAPAVPTDRLNADADADTIRVLLDHVRILVAYDEQRANQLVARGTGLIGFASIGVAVLTVGSKSQNFAIASRIFIALAIVLLIFCVGSIVLGIFATRPVRHQSIRQIRLYANKEYWTLPPGRVQVQMLDSLVRRLDTLRESNRVRASWLNRAALALVLAVTSAGLASTIGTIFASQTVTSTPERTTHERRR